MDTTGRMARARRGRRRRAAALLAAWTSLAVACGGRAQSFSDKAERYLPERIDGRRVNTDSTDARTFGGTFKGPGIDALVSGSVGEKDDTTSVSNDFPDVMVFAFKGEVAGARTEIRRMFLPGRGTAEADGVKVEFLEASANGKQGFLALAAPKADVACLAVAFRGGKRAALSALRAMLVAGDNGGSAGT